MTLSPIWVDHACHARFQAEMTPTASNVLFGWWSHDIGGPNPGGTNLVVVHGYRLPVAHGIGFEYKIEKQQSHILS